MKKLMFAICAAAAMVACGTDPVATGGGFTPILNDKQLAQSAPEGEYRTQDFALTSTSCWGNSDCFTVFNQYRGCASSQSSQDTYWCASNQCNLRYTSGFSISCVINGGQCTSNSNCASGQVCENYRCVAGNQQGWSCDDGNSCTDNDRFNSLGSCVGTQRTCNDGNSCTNDYCSAGACVFSQNCGTGYTCNSWGTCDWNGNNGGSNWNYRSRIRFEVKYPSWWSLSSLDVEGQYCKSGTAPWDCVAANWDYWGRWWLSPSTRTEGTSKISTVYLDVLPEAKNYNGYLRFTMPVSGTGFTANNVFNRLTGWNGEGGTPRFYDDNGSEIFPRFYSGSGGGSVAVIYMDRSR